MGLSLVSRQFKYGSISDEGNNPCYTEFCGLLNDPSHFLSFEKGLGQDEGRASREGRGLNLLNFGLQPLLRNPLDGCMISMSLVVIEE
jgi:hypothetical protein